MERFEDSLREIFDAQNFWFPCTAEVVSFDKSKQTADILPFAAIGGEQAPVLKGAPVLELAGGGWEIDVHLQPGDQVLAIFAATQVALWLTGSNEEQNVDKPQLHNAIVIPCLSRITGRTADTSPGVTIKNSAGTIAIEMTEVGILIKANPGLIQVESPAGIFGLATHTHAAGTPNTGPPNPGS